MSFSSSVYSTYTNVSVSKAVYIAIAKYSYCVRLNGFSSRRRCYCCCCCWLVKALKAAFNRFVSKQNRTEELFGYIMSWQQTLPLVYTHACVCVCTCMQVKFVFSWGCKYLLRESFILKHRRVVVMANKLLLALALDCILCFEPFAFFF